ncbi:hypothetical protein pb186bvf_011404 [Paramecium bursaria]
MQFKYSLVILPQQFHLLIKIINQQFDLHLVFLISQNNHTSFQLTYQIKKYFQYVINLRFEKTAQDQSPSQILLSQITLNYTFCQNTQILYDYIIYRKYMNISSNQTNISISTKGAQLASLNQLKETVLEIQMLDLQLEMPKKADGDHGDLQPESEGRAQRFDMFKTPIVKNLKLHKVTFKDQIQQQRLNTQQNGKMGQMMRNVVAHAIYSD